MSNPISNRYDFVVYFDVENGNPNGDPDAGNMPRIDPESGYGLVTDVCLKRKIRNYVEIVMENEPGFEIYIKEGIPLNNNDGNAASKYGVDIKKKTSAQEAKKKDPSIGKKIRDFMCAEYYDVRTFGAVMTGLNTKDMQALNCGQVRGPVQLTFAKSVDPVIPMSIGLTRVTGATEKGTEDRSERMGQKYIIPYGLYRYEGFVSANLARKTTGFSEEDAAILWDAIINMFEHDHSAVRGKMVVRSLIVFKHASELGNAPSYKLFDAVSIQKKPGIEAPRSFKDYEDVIINEAAIPEGVEVICKL